MNGVRHRPLGKTGLFVSEMALGTWGLSGDAYGRVDEATQRKVISRALDMGFTLFDTADAYGAGRMERLLGQATRGRDDLVIVTKGGIDRTTLPAKKRFDAAYIRGAVERSLKRLRRQRIEVYLLHNPSESALSGQAGEDASGAMLELKKSGKVAHWGVSAGDLSVARIAIRIGAEVVELAYNLLHSTDMHRLAGDVVVSGAGVLARSTLAHGLLAGHWRQDREFEAGDHRADRWTRPELARRVEQLASLRFLLNRDVLTMRAAAVRFVLASSIVSSAVLGPRTVSQLEELVREVGVGPVYLREGDLARLPHVLDAAGIEI